MTEREKTVSEKNEPKGKITPLVQIGVDESGRTVIHAAKDLKVDRTLLARILEAWGAFYPKLVAEMPDPPHPSRDNDSKGPLTCPECAQQALNYHTGKCYACGFTTKVHPSMADERDAWEPRSIHCRECGRDVRIETRPDDNVVKCGCGRDIYVGPERRKRD